MAKAPGIHYVDNKKFYATIADHRRKLKEAREQGKPEPKIPDYIGECIYNIAKKLATKACFASYSFRDEMVSDAIENCILYYESFDPDYGENAFSYFTQVVYYAFIRRINMEQKNRYTMYKYFSEAVAECNNSGLFVDSDGNHLLTKQVYDNINDFMVRYEEKELKKKHKRKVAKEAKNSLARFAEEKQPDGADNQ